MSLFGEESLARRRRRSAIRELLSKSDAQLDDLGYVRGMLEWALRQRDSARALTIARKHSRPYLRLPTTRFGA